MEEEKDCKGSSNVLCKLLIGLYIHRKEHIIVKKLRMKIECDMDDITVSGYQMVSAFSRCLYIVDFLNRSFRIGVELKRGKCASGLFKIAL